MYKHNNCKRACCSQNTRLKISNALTKIPWAKFVCPCGKKFVGKKLKRHKSPNKFCSIRCVYKYGARMGVPLSEQSRKKLSIKYTGSGSPSWKGGISKDKKWVTKRQTALRNKKRKEVIDYYGGKCACCGETEYKFLAIDHINNDGAEHRKRVGGNHLFQTVIKEGMPKDRFQILCHNCNFAKSHWKGCPHKK